MSIIYYLHIPPLKSDLVVIKPEANWGLLNNLHIYGEHLTPDSLEENKGNKKIYSASFCVQSLLLIKQGPNLQP